MKTRINRFSDRLYEENITWYFSMRALSQKTRVRSRRLILSLQLTYEN